MSLNNLKLNKVRSLLTSLGIIIGIAAVITTFSASEGLKLQIQKQIEGMGSSNIFITDWMKPIQVSDARFLEKYNPKIQAISRYYSDSVQVVYKKYEEKGDLFGVDINYFKIFPYKTILGRNLNESDQDSIRKNAVIGYEIFHKLFKGPFAVGEKVNIFVKDSVLPIRVVGVLEEKGKGMHSPDENVYLPMSTYKIFFGANSEPSTTAKVFSESDVDIGKNIAFTLLKNNHPNLKLKTAKEMVKFGLELSSKFSIIGYSLSIICLLVGGVGLMNIMLAAVAERKREVGIKRSIGFTTHVILLQFLIESLILSFLGGILGFLFGIVGGNLFSLVTEAPAVISMKVGMVAFVFSAVVGCGFGFFPAKKASQLDPTEALRG